MPEVEGTLIISGDVSSFDELAFKESFAEQLGVPVTAITLVTAPGSVILGFTITLSNLTQAEMAVRALSSNGTNANRVLFDDLGVESINPTGITYIDIYAPSPPPPSPPPPIPPTAPPSSPPGPPEGPPPSPPHRRQTLYLRPSY